MIVDIILTFMTAYKKDLKIEFDKSDPDHKLFNNKVHDESHDIAEQN